MIEGFDKVEVKSLADNIFQLLDDEWMLITAGNKESFNTMTASWGGFGILWQKPIAICFIRPQRYTFGFVEESPYFTLSFFSDKYKALLNYCGQKSGRHFDKVRETGLLPLETETGNIAFEQARIIMECKKLYSDSIKPEYFLNTDLIKQNYPGKDFHRFFIGEITNCYVKQEK